MADVVRGSQMANVDPRRLDESLFEFVYLSFYDMIVFITINFNKLDALETVH